MTLTSDTSGNLHHGAGAPDGGQFAEKQNARPAAGLGLKNDPFYPWADFEADGVHSDVYELWLQRRGNQDDDEYTWGDFKSEMNDPDSDASQFVRNRLAQKGGAYWFAILGDERQEQVNDALGCPFEELESEQQRHLGKLFEHFGLARGDDISFDDALDELSAWGNAEDYSDFEDVARILQEADEDEGFLFDLQYKAESGYTGYVTSHFLGSETGMYLSSEHDLKYLRTEHTGLRGAAEAAANLYSDYAHVRSQAAKLVGAPAAPKPAFTPTELAAMLENIREHQGDYVGDAEAVIDELLRLSPASDGTP